MKTSLLSLIFLLLSCFGFAQKKIGVVGTLIDSAKRGNNINSATISLYKDTDSALLFFTISDETGVFKFNNLSNDISYKIVISSWLYKTHRINFKLTNDSTSLNLGRIELALKINELNEVDIISERPPIIIRNNTIEFNAASFKTLPTSFVEDLFKKLPGFTIGSDGNILVNGKKVSRILVEGKDFFGGDQQIATKQLPANIIDKVIVADDDLIKKRNQDLGEGQIPQIINLTLKKGIKKGAFGKVYAGHGLSKNYEVGGIINAFRDTTQISVLGYKNNINRSGFTLSDITRIGGFERSGYSNTVMNESGSFSLDDISFGGGDNGKQTSLGTGINLNTVTKNGIKLNGKYYFGNSNVSTEQLITDNQSIDQQNLLTKSTITTTNIVKKHNLSGKLEWPINDLTTIYIEPSVILGPAIFNSGINKNTSSAVGMINSSNAYSNSRNTIGQYVLSADLDKSFKKKGRSLIVSLLGQSNNSAKENYNFSESQFNTTNSSLTIDQLRENTIKKTSILLNGNFTETISKKLSLGISTSETLLNNENAILTYLKNPQNSNYDLFSPDYSETVNQKGFKSFSRIRLKLTINKNLNIQPAISLTTISLRNQFRNYPSIEQRYAFFAPALNIKYKILTIEYTPTFQEANVQYLQPVLDNTDPLFIYRGNPNLRPTVTYPLYMRIYNYNPKTFFNYNLFGRASIKKGSIIMSRIIASDGVQTNTPVSVNNVWELSSGGGFGKNFNNKSRQININGSFNIRYSRDFVEINNVRSQVKNLSAAPTLGARLNFNDIVELNHSYTITLSKAKYEDNYFSNQHFFSQTIVSEIVLRPFKKVVFDNQVRALLNNRNILGYKNDVTYWNMGITYLLLKNDRMQFRVAVNDLLNTNVRRNILITENSIRDVQTNGLGRFAMATISYNIQSFGSKQKKSTILGEN